MTTAEYLTEKREELRKIMAEYFYLIGDDEVSQDIQTESHERLLVDAYTYSICHFQNCIKEYKEYKGEK